MSFLVQQKLMNVTLTKSEPKQTVIVFSSSVSCEPKVTICRSFRSYVHRRATHALVTWIKCNQILQFVKTMNIKKSLMSVRERWINNELGGKAREVRTYLWFFSILSCSNVTNSSNIKQIHFMLLVKPIKIKPLFVYP